MKIIKIIPQQMIILIVMISIINLHNQDVKKLIDTSYWWLPGKTLHLSISRHSVICHGWIDSSLDGANKESSICQSSLARSSVSNDFKSSRLWSLERFMFQCEWLV